MAASGASRCLLLRGRLSGGTELAYSGRPARQLRVTRAPGGEARLLGPLMFFPTSTSAQAAIFRPDVVIAGRDTKILIDQIRTIDTRYVSGELVDYLSRDDMAQVEHCLSRHFGLLR